MEDCAKLTVTHPALLTYAEAHTSPQSALLDEITTYTHAHTSAPSMLSGHLQGRLLALLAQLMRPNRILEIGTFTGFSALCLAEGLAPNGRLFTLDIDETHQHKVKDFFARSPYASRIEYHIGDALTLIPQLKENWNMVFIDAHKPQYIAYYKAVFEQVVPEGLIIADNVLWSGRVVQEAKQNACDSARALHAFNEYVAQDKRVEPLLLPVRDGLSLIRKKV